MKVEVSRRTNPILKAVEKYCKNCGRRLVIRRTVDIDRKNFCSRVCSSTWNYTNGKCGSFAAPGNPMSAESRAKMSKRVQERLAAGWKPVGWLKYPPQKRLSSRGYYFLGNKREHTVLIEQELGRKLLSTEVVHHIDGDKLNNSLDNLIAMDRSEHLRLHAQRRLEQIASEI